MKKQIPSMKIMMPPNNGNTADVARGLFKHNVFKQNFLDEEELEIFLNSEKIFLEISYL
jgi:hypothetical protein